MLKETLDILRDSVLDNNSKNLPIIFTTTTSANIKVYRHNYLFGLLQALQRRYPAVARVLQADNFKFFAKEFIYAHPSTVSNIDNYGENFAVFLQQRPELQNLPYLSDLAQLDDVYYRHDPHYQVQVNYGSAYLWEKIRRDKTPTTLVIDTERQQQVNLVDDRNGSFCLQIQQI